MKYFSSPKQVKFLDPDTRSYNYGIAVGSIIICGCCGGVFEIDNLTENGCEIIELPWIDISEAICGD